VADQIPDSAKLLPCPFCGSDDVSMSFSATLQSPEPAARFVECEDCAACGAGVTIVDGDDDAAKAAAVVAWNTRVTSPAGQEASRAAPPAMDREAVETAADVKRSIIRQLSVQPDYDRVILSQTDWDIVLSALSTLSADAIRQAEGIRPMVDAPKDGTMVRLLVDYSDGGGALEDDHPRSWTIGFNGFEDTGEDEWKFAGWCWSHDHFTQGSGEPVGWLPWSNPSTGGDDR